MKKTVLLSILVLALTSFTACTQNGTGSTESITAPTTKEETTSVSTSTSAESQAETDDLAGLFEEYSATESKESADKILGFFKSDIKTFLSTLAATEYREQVLMLLGSEISAANKDGDTSYQDVIDDAQKMSLSAEESEALGFIIANINADY